MPLQIKPIRFSSLHVKPGVPPHYVFLGGLASSTPTNSHFADSPKPKIRLDQEEVISMLASLLNTPPSDSRLDYASRGYEDAKKGDKCNLWQIRNMGHALISDRDKREEWIAQRQKLYEHAYDLSLSRHFPRREKEFVRVRK